MKLPSVYVKSIDDIQKNLSEGLSFIEWTKIITPGSTVFIKPNLTWTEYTPGVTTSPDLIRCLISIIKDRAGRIIVGESDGGNHAFTADDAFRGHGLDRICREQGIELVNLSRLPSVEIEEEVLGKRVRVVLPKMLVDEVDCFISVPVLKVHAMTGVSLSIKNLWGCYSDPMRCLHHKHLDYKLALIARKVNPRIVVIDGKYALDNHGPMFGTPTDMNLLICSDNPVLADVTGAEIMGMHPSEFSRFGLGGVRPTRLSHISVAIEAGLGQTESGGIRRNCDWKEFVKHFVVRRTLMDRLCMFTFNSEFVSRIVFKSVLTKSIFALSDKFIRNQTELQMATSCRNKPNSENEHPRSSK